MQEGKGDALMKCIFCEEEQVFVTKFWYPPTEVIAYWRCVCFACKAGGGNHAARASASVAWERVLKYYKIGYTQAHRYVYVSDMKEKGESDEPNTEMAKDSK